MEFTKEVLEAKIKNGDADDVMCVHAGTSFALPPLPEIPQDTSSVVIRFAGHGMSSELRSIDLVVNKPVLKSLLEDIITTAVAQHVVEESDPLVMLFRHVFGENSGFTPSLAQIFSTTKEDDGS